MLWVEVNHSHLSLYFMIAYLCVHQNWYNWIVEFHYCHLKIGNKKATKSDMAKCVNGTQHSLFLEFVWNQVNLMRKSVKFLEKKNFILSEPTFNLVQTDRVKSDYISKINAIILVWLCVRWSTNRVNHLQMKFTQNPNTQIHFHLKILYLFCMVRQVSKMDRKLNFFWRFNLSSTEKSLDKHRRAYHCHSLRLYKRVTSLFLVFPLALSLILPSAQIKAMKIWKKSQVNINKSECVEDRSFFSFLGTFYSRFVPLNEMFKK